MSLRNLIYLSGGDNEDEPNSSKLVIIGFVILFILIIGVYFMIPPAPSPPTKLCINNTCLQESDLQALVSAPTKLCINSTCMQEADLKALVAPPTKLCINSTCMQESDLKALVAPPTKLCINSTCMQESDLKRVNNLFPSGYINIVNKRPLFGIGMETNSNVITGATPKLLIPAIVYNPFGYNVPEPAPGTTRKFRLYCVYSDSITGGDGPVVRLSVLDSQWAEANNFVDFKLPLTWGGLGAETRDAYSQLVSIPPNPMHCKLYSFVPATATGTPSVLWQYIELQALDVYP